MHQSREWVVLLGRSVFGGIVGGDVKGIRIGAEGPLLHLPSAQIPPTIAAAITITNATTNTARLLQKKNTYDGLGFSSSLFFHDVDSDEWRRSLFDLLVLTSVTACFGLGPPL